MALRFIKEIGKEFSNAVLQPLKDRKLGDAIEANDDIEIEKALNKGANPNSPYYSSSVRGYNSSGVSFIEDALSTKSAETIMALIDSDKADFKTSNRKAVEIFLGRDDFVGVKELEVQKQTSEILRTLFNKGADFQIVEWNDAKLEATTLFDRNLKVRNDFQAHVENRVHAESAINKIRAFGGMSMTELRIEKERQGVKYY